jgi:glycogen(starch) synthase
MKILIVSETMPAKQLGGLAKHAITKANALIEMGHEVALLGLQDIDYEACRQEMGFKGRFIAGLPPDRGWKENALGCFNPLRRPVLARQMAAAIQAHAAGFDVVHYHGNWPLVAAYIPSHINFVQTRHDQGSECLVHVRYKASGMCTELDPAACAACATPSPNLAQRFVSTQSVRLYRHIAAQALSQHKTIFVSEAIRSNAARVLPASAFARSWVIHNFIDQARLSRDTQGLAPHADPAQPWQVLIASRLDEAKGVAPFLAQWTLQRPGQTRLLLVGDGPDRLQMEALYAGPGVEFLKHQPYETTLKLTASSHAAVVPSLCEEACSTTILEALYLGVPCFALRRGGNPELARYERWPGQLQLFNSAPELVQALVQHLGKLPVQRMAADAPAAALSDVHAALPSIIQVYES